VSAPGVTATLLAPVVTQLSVLWEPDLMPAGLAVKDLTAGAEPVCGLVVAGSGLLVEPPQPVRSADATRTRAAAQRPNPARTELSFRLAVEGGERKRNPSVATPIHNSCPLALPAGCNDGVAQYVADFLQSASGRRFATVSLASPHTCTRAGLNPRLISREFHTADGARLLHGRIPAADAA
jgi:hypothetical protein